MGRDRLEVPLAVPLHCLQELLVLRHRPVPALPLIPAYFARGSGLLLLQRCSELDHFLREALDLRTQLEVLLREGQKRRHCALLSSVHAWSRLCLCGCSGVEWLLHPGHVVCPKVFHARKRKRFVRSRRVCRSSPRETPRHEVGVAYVEARGLWSTSSSAPPIPITVCVPDRAILLQAHILLFLCELRVVVLCMRHAKRPREPSVRRDRFGAG
mmetsp:Transcript_50378/g.101106  ORF Transcript_50378/g.101106 Transcript_50378/m.101106 type:complete len:213 (+) Transcript_50378:292-930(+)